MLTAHYRGNVIVAPDAEREPVKRLSRAGLLYCPACEREVVFHAGVQKAWHFKHKATASDCPFDTDPDYRPESELHVRMKLAVRDWVRAQFPPERYPGAEVDVEVHVPETGQFADVMLTLPGEGEQPARVALEVQCSPLTGAQWRERAARYASAGVLDVWLLTEQREAPKPKHVEVGPEGLRMLKDLPGTVLLDRGRVLVATADADALKAEGPGAVRVEVLHGLAACYDGLEGPEASAEAARARPVDQQPEWLERRTPWSRLRRPPASFKPAPGAYFDAFLPEGWVEPGAEMPERVLWVSEAHRAADARARAWEAANQEWHAEWTPRRAAYDREQAAKRAEAERDAEASRAARAREMHRLIGEAVQAALPGLLSAAGALAQAGTRSRNERSLRQHPALPEGVRKWRLASWTPLADVAVPLDWAFGVDPRLWQMAVYAYGLSAMYAKGFRDEQGIDVVGFDRVATGYALKVLASKGLLRVPQARRMDSLLSDLNKSLQKVAAPYADLVASDWEQVPILALDPHRLRHLVVGAYLGVLASHTFLSGPEEAVREPGQRWGNLVEDVRALHEALGTPADVLNRIRECLRVLARRTGAHDAEELGASWLRLVETTMCVPTGEFDFVTPMLPPFYEREVAAGIRRAMQAGTLRVTQQGVSVGGDLLYEVPPRYQRARLW